MFITHLHHDHFDPAAIKVELPEPIPLGEFLVIPVPAVDGLGERQVSWVVIGGGRRIIHCGDTVWHGWFQRIGRTYGPFDAAFLPINGAQVLSVTPRAELPMVLTPEHAVAAAVALGARQICPIHYGLHNPKAYLEHPDAEPTLFREAQRRGVSVERVPPGEWVAWKPRGT